MTATLDEVEETPTWWERRTEMPRHLYRISYEYRDRRFWQLFAVAAVIGAVGLLVRRPIDGWSWAVAASVVATVLLARGAVLAPPLAPHAHGLPGLDAPATCRDTAPRLDAFVIAVRVLAPVVVLLAAVGLSAEIVAIATGVLALVAAPILVAKALVWRARLRIRRAMQRHDPRWAMVYGGFAGGPTHMSMWDPYLRASGDPGVVINARAEYCTELRTGANMPMPWVQLGSDRLADLRPIVVPSIGGFFHVHNAPVHLVYFGVRKVTHVWLGHGDSDKPGSRHRRHRKFDLLAVAGQASIDRYAAHDVEIPRENFVIVGRPQVGDIERAEQPITAIERPRVLYTPTWTKKDEAYDFSSIRQGPAIVRALIDAGADVIFRPHPVFLRLGMTKTVDRIHRVMKDDSRDPDTPGSHTWGHIPNTEWSIVDCINHADALLSDVSSVVSDWLQTTKPYAMISMRHSLEEFPDAIPVARAGYLVAGDLSNIAPVLDDMLHRDPLAEERRVLKEHVLGPYDGRESEAAFARLVHGVGSRTFDRSEWPPEL